MAALHRETAPSEDGVMENIDSCIFGIMWVRSRGEEQGGDPSQELVFRPENFVFPPGEEPPESLEREPPLAFKLLEGESQGEAKIVVAGPGDIPELRESRWSIEGPGRIRVESLGEGNPPLVAGEVVSCNANELRIGP
jgi:hypothetical protein